MLFCLKMFPVHVVISILQAFNCRCLEIFVQDNVLLEVKLYETKSKKEFVPYTSNAILAMTQQKLN